MMLSVNQETLFKNHHQLDLDVNRDADHKVFTNKSLRLENIKCFGFDMDYTLAEYNSPEFEIMVYELLVKRMVEIGYPKQLENIKYDNNFPIRGLWADRKLGNLLKTDNYGNILVGFHGFNKLNDADILAQYPNRCIQFDTSRIMVTDTYYSLPRNFLIAATISYLESLEGCIKNDTHMILNGDVIEYAKILKDSRDSMIYVHVKNNTMKNNILNNLEKYVKRSRKLPEMILQLKSQGTKVFLLTNSDYEYTKVICQYIFLCSGDNGNEWKKYFDYIIVSAKKPAFFLGGNVMNKINESSNTLEIEDYKGPLESGCVYSGGSADLFSKQINISGKHILYFGDHIYGDVVISKKLSGWNTCLIVPEIKNEIDVWKNRHMLDKLNRLEYKLNKCYRDVDPVMTKSLRVKIVQKKISEISKYIGKRHGSFGSLFRYENRRTFFADQSTNYADIYTSTVLNLLYYPTSHVFRAPECHSLLMPHEMDNSCVEEKNLFQI